MDWVVYCLYSESYDEIYLGYSSSLIERFYSHNSLSTDSYTVRYRPWKVIYVEFCENQKQAMKREKEIKSGAGRRWIRNVQLTLMREIGFIH